MKIAIIGSGNVGSGLANALGHAGHHIIFGSRNPAPGQTNEATIESAARAADAIILAIPFAAAFDVIAAGGGFVGKIVIDVTNPLGMGENGLGLTLGFTTSGAETIAAMAPKALLFKAFNQTGIENMAEAAAYALRPVMFVAGDDQAAKPKVMALVSDIGFEAIDAGGLVAARLLEPLGMLWIELARKRGHGPDFAFTLQRKGSAK